VQSLRPVENRTPRGYLLLLHVIFCSFYIYQLQSVPVTLVERASIVGLAILTLFLLTLPQTQLVEPWFMASLTLGDSAVLFSALQSDGHPGAWSNYALTLLLAMACYAASIHQMIVLSVLLVIGYGFSLHHSRWLDTETLLIFPALLSLVLVLLSKTRYAQEEVQRIADTEAQVRQESMSDALTGIPNRAQFVERVTRSLLCARQNREFQFAVLFIDLDGFKPINDKFGHKAGDAVLQMALNGNPLLDRQLVVVELLEPFLHVFAPRDVHHDRLSRSWCRSACRARVSRDFTVPTATPSENAISS